MREHLSQLVKDAMKAGDKPRLGVLRLIQSALKNREIELRGEEGRELGPEDIEAVLYAMAKQRRDSIAAYEGAAREDLATLERAELGVIQDFLPKQMDEAEVRAAIAAAIVDTGASGLKDMKRVIEAVKAKHGDRIDFTKASGLVKAMLAKP